MGFGCLFVEGLMFSFLGTSSFLGLGVLDAFFLGSDVLLGVECFFCWGLKSVLGLNVLFWGSDVPLMVKCPLSCGLMSF